MSRIVNCTTTEVDGTIVQIERTYIPDAQEDCWRYAGETAWRTGEPPLTDEEWWGDDDCEDLDDGW